MSNFKGTKGPWGYDVDENNQCIDLVLPNDTVISHSRHHIHTGELVIDREEMNANMKAISKVTELIEMLERVVSEYHFEHGPSTFDPTISEIESLLKSTTL